MMDSKPNADPAIFDAAVLAATQRLIPPERLHAYLRKLDREHLALVNSAAADPSLQSQAHNIVSQAGMLGLTRMSESARALENASPSGTGPVAELLLCRAAAGDVWSFAMPAVGSPAVFLPRTQLEDSIHQCSQMSAAAHANRGNSMYSKMQLEDSLDHRASESRAEERTTIALPILIDFSGSLQGALLRNLSSDGAMIETSAPLGVRAKIKFLCGTIDTDCTVLWRNDHTFGIKFRSPISKRQLGEQLSRSEAITQRRDQRELHRQSISRIG